MGSGLSGLSLSLSPSNNSLAARVSAFQALSDPLVMERQFLAWAPWGAPHWQGEADEVPPQKPHLSQGGVHICQEIGTRQAVIPGPHPTCWSAPGLPTAP